MAKTPKGSAKHQAIISAARDLFYRKGYEATSFTDIADSAELNRGNFYYYYRSKEEILADVVDSRAEELKQTFRDVESEATGGRDRLIKYLDRFGENREMRSLYGCAMGTLAMELAKGERPLVDLPLRLITLTLDWLEAQFRHAPSLSHPRAYAIETLCRMQGVALMGAVLNQPELLDRQFGAIKDWIRHVFQETSRPARKSLARQGKAGSRPSPVVGSSPRERRIASSSKRS